MVNFQRAATDKLQIELIRVFGEDFYQKGGTCVSYIPEKKRAQIRKALDNLDTVVMVKGDSGKVVTLMHRNKKFNTRKEYA